MISMQIYTQHFLASSISFGMKLFLWDITNGNIWCNLFEVRSKISRAKKIGMGKMTLISVRCT